MLVSVCNAKPGGFYQADECPDTHCFERDIRFKSKKKVNFLDLNLIIS